jgi:magnesium-transporting ATPase (P-type)
MVAHATGSVSLAQQNLGAYWTLGSAELLRRLDSTDQGLSSAAAADRLRRFGRNQLKEEQAFSRMRILWKQVRSPLLLLLVFAAGVSAATGEWTDAVIVGAIVLVVGIGYKRECSAEVAVAALRARVKTRGNVLRPPADAGAARGGGFGGHRASFRGQHRSSGRSPARSHGLSRE